MAYETNVSTLPIAEAIRGAAGFSAAQETELSRRVGNDVANLLETSGLDPRLVDTFRAHVAEPVEVQFDGAFNGEKSEAHVTLPLSVADSSILSIMAIGRKSVERWAGIILGTALERHGIRPQYAEQTYDITNAWVIAHELGHGLSQMHRWLHRTESSHPGRWAYPITPGDFLIAHPEAALAQHPEDATIIEDERQAEGIGSLYLRQLLIETGLADEHQARLITDEVRALFDEHAIPRRAMLRPDISLSETNQEKAPEDRHGVNVIGYVSPLSAEELRQRFALHEEALYTPHD